VIPSCDNSKMTACLSDRYDLYCYDSKSSEDKKETKLVAMMGSDLMITMFENNGIQINEINTARKLNIPILFIYDSVEEKINDSDNKEENIIVFENIEEIVMIIKNKFKLIKKIKKQNDLPFKTLQNKTKLFEFNKLNSISLLVEEKQLISTGDKVQSYNVNTNSLEALQALEFNDGQSNACVNNQDKEIIFLKKNLFSKYNFDFDKISEDNILSLEKDVVIDEIVVNEENKHIYGISNNFGMLYHFNNEFKIMHKMEIVVPLLIKVFKSNLYMLLTGDGNSSIEERGKNRIIENQKSFINIYSQKGEENIKFNKKIILDVLIRPNNFHVDENYIFIFSRYSNKHRFINFKSYIFLFSHDGIFLQKTGLDINDNECTKFLIVDNETIYCADDITKNFHRLDFN
jgi:hypothetical protein